MTTNLERAREQLAAWMIEHSFATGHGDTFEDLLKELSWQVKELRQAARLAALEEAAQVADDARVGSSNEASRAHYDHADEDAAHFHLGQADIAEDIAQAIRAQAAAPAKETK